MSSISSARSASICDSSSSVASEAVPAASGVAVVCACFGASTTPEGDCEPRSFSPTLPTRGLGLGRCSARGRGGGVVAGWWLPVAPESRVGGAVALRAGASTSASGFQKIQSVGAGGQAGLGSHPGGGTQPTGGSGQPGGVLKTRRATSVAPNAVLVADADVASRVLRDNSSEICK